MTHSPARARPVVIAIDGPSGSGKSSAARGVASALGLRYLDTGAMYRALTWWLLEHGTDVTDPEEVVRYAPGLSLEIGTDPGRQRVRIEGIDVTTAIRSRRVSNVVSLVAAVPGIRRHLIAAQRQIIAEAVASGTGIVAEGRDIGTVVAPDADVKVFLTASERVRAQRRAAELAAALAPPEGASPNTDVTSAAAPSTAQTRIEQNRRDRRDAAQTQVAADAIELDATDLPLDAVISRIAGLAAARLAGA